MRVALIVLVIVLAVVALAVFLIRSYLGQFNYSYYALAGEIKKTLPVPPGRYMWRVSVIDTECYYEERYGWRCSCNKTGRHKHVSKSIKCELIDLIEDKVAAQRTTSSVYWAVLQDTKTRRLQRLAKNKIVTDVHTAVASIPQLYEDLV